MQVVPLGAQTDPYIWDKLPNENSSIQMIRTCTYYREKEFIYQPTWSVEFKDWYWPTKVGHICWDPITEKVAQIVDDPICPYYDPDPTLSKPCLDVNFSAIPDTGEPTFRNYVQNNPDWIWLIGNEPDGISQDALVESIQVRIDGVLTTIQIGGPDAYATFFKEIYEIIDDEITVQPKLVFCQATYAWDKPEFPNFGTNYCRSAFDQLQVLGLGSSQIYALSTHQYMHEPESFGNLPFQDGELLDGQTQPEPGNNNTVLEFTINTWESYLQGFEAWAQSEGMDNKPLWLTEYGSLKA